MIRIAGQWLSDAGFKVGDRLIIEVSRYELYITRSVTKGGNESTFG